MSHEVEVVSGITTLNIGVSDFDEKYLPEVIQGQVAKLDELDKKVKEAQKAAEDAKASADKAKSKSAGWLQKLFQKNAAIEELQSVAVDLATAVQFGAEAQKISFDFQTKLAKITKYLFGLGVSNITANRMVVRALDLKLKGASQDKLSELAQQEIFLVIKQLKDQEDILKKQEDFANAVKAYDARLRESEKTALEQGEQIQTLALSSQHLAEVINDHDVGLKEQQKIHQELKERIDAQNEVAVKQEEQMKNQFEAVHAQTIQIAELKANNNELAERLDASLKVIEKVENKFKYRMLMLAGSVALMCIVMLGLRFF